MEIKRKRLQNKVSENSEFSEMSENSENSEVQGGGGKARRAALGVECSPRYAVIGWVLSLYHLFDEDISAHNVVEADGGRTRLGGDVRTTLRTDTIGISDRLR